MKAKLSTVEQMANVIEKMAGTKEADTFVKKVVKQPKVKVKNGRS